MRHLHWRSVGACRCTDWLQSREAQLLLPTAAAALSAATEAVQLSSTLVTGGLLSHRSAMQCLDYLHTDLGLEWWAAIVVASGTLRLVSMYLFLGQVRAPPLLPPILLPLPIIPSV